MSFNLGNALKSLAPTVASMLLGPFAGQAVAGLESVLGLAPGSGVDAVSKVLQSGQLTPELAAKIKELEIQQATAFAQQKIDLVKINLDHEAAIAATDAGDRASAREREVAVKDWTPAMLAWLIVVATCGCAYFVLSGQVTKDPSLAALSGSVIGYLFNEAKSVFSYYFGSSSGSQAKDATIKALSSSD